MPEARCVFIHLYLSVIVDAHAFMEMFWYQKQVEGAGQSLGEGSLSPPHLKWNMISSIVQYDRCYSITCVKTNSYFSYGYLN